MCTHDMYFYTELCVMNTKHTIMSVVDPREAPGMHAPGPISFIFMQFSGEN